MYEYITGTLIQVTPEYTVVEAGGIGYRLFTPLSVLSAGLAPKSTVQFYLSPVYREDSQKLFAFLTLEERTFFEKLSSISGIGPKTALSLIGHMSASELTSAIQTSNAKLISRVPGIGQKTAERLIVEMKDKLHLVKKKAPTPIVTDGDHLLADGVNALINLGYNNDRASAAIQKAMDKLEGEAKLDSLIKLALQGI